MTVGKGIKSIPVAPIGAVHTTNLKTAVALTATGRLSEQRQKVSLFDGMPLLAVPSKGGLA
jgi:hypothetical protein